MNAPNRREILQGLLGGLLTTASTVVLARAALTPEACQAASTESVGSIEERADRLVEQVGPLPDGEENPSSCFVNGGFRKGGFVNGGGGGGFRNSGFANGGGGGGFRNSGFANGGGGGGGFHNGGFANGGGGGFRNGGFANGAFRN